MDRYVQSDIRAFDIAGDWKATALKAEVWVETVTEGERRTSPGEERGNETRSVGIAHGSVEFCEATPIDLVDESKESLYGRDSDRDLRSACRGVT